MGMAKITEWPSTMTTTNYGSPIRYAWHWRRPRRPFHAPECCGRSARRIKRDVWRCTGLCHAKIWPERLHHRLMLRWNPFCPDVRPLRHLFKVELGKEIR